MPGNAKTGSTERRNSRNTLFLVLLSPQSFIRSDAKLLRKITRVLPLGGMPDALNTKANANVNMT